MAIADKLQSILDSKAAIKAAIEEKGVENVGDVLADYPSKIASIQSGGSGWTGHADVEGLKAIGWTDEDIEYYQQHGVNWNEEDDEYHKVPQDNIDLYGVINTENIRDYKDILVYLPKIDTSGVTNMSAFLKNCENLVAIPLLDTSGVTNMQSMFEGCSCLICVPLLDTSGVTNMQRMFGACSSLKYLPQLDTNKTKSIQYLYNSCSSLGTIRNLNAKAASTIGLFQNCYNLVSIEYYDMSTTTTAINMLAGCCSLRNATLKNLKISLDIKNTNLITKDSLLYIINNEAAESPITITLSAYCYNKYNADEDITAALAVHPNVSLASA